MKKSQPANNQKAPIPDEKPAQGVGQPENAPETNQEPVKHEITQDEYDNNPGIGFLGFSVGDVITIEDVLICVNNFVLIAKETIAANKSDVEEYVVIATRDGESRTFPQNIWDQMPQGKYGYKIKSEIPKELR